MNKAAQKRERLQVILETNLNPVFIALQIQAAETVGWDISSALAMVGEQLTVPENFAMEAFWKWCKKNGKEWGEANIHFRWTEWKIELRRELANA